MPRRPAIDLLPDDVRAELDRRLVASGFGGYVALEAWLGDQGFEIGKSQIHRHGQALEEKLSAIRASTQAAAAIAEAAPDDADQRSAAVISLVQTEVFNVLVGLQQAEAEEDPTARIKLLSKVAKSVAELSRASVNLKKFQTTVADRVRAAADAIEKKARKGGLSAATVDEIKREILGIAQ